MSGAVVFFLGGIGDQILAWPAMRAIGRATGGKAVLAAPRCAVDRLWCDVPLAGRVALDPTVSLATPIDGLDAVRGAEVLVSLTSWPHEAKLRRMLAGVGARRTIGFFPLYDEVVAFDPGAHMLEKYYAVARHVAGGDAVLEKDDGPPALPPEAEIEAGLAVGHLRGPKGLKLLFFHPETKAEKRWSEDAWCSVLSGFLLARQDFAALVVSRDGYALGAPAWVRERVAHFQTPLLPALAAVRHADLFLGVDSCFLHAADAHRVPGVAVFGPTSPGAWGFKRSPLHRHVVAERGDLSRLSPGPVLEALLSVAKAL